MSLMPPTHTLSNEHLLPQDQIQRQILEDIVYEQRLFSKSGTHDETGVHGDIFVCDSFVGCVAVGHGQTAWNDCEETQNFGKRHRWMQVRAPIFGGCHVTQKERLVISGGRGQISSRTTERLRTPPRGLDRSEPDREDTVRTSSRGGYSLSRSTQ